MNKAPYVGLTGGIGAGKSEALAALERLGAATLSTDRVVHSLYERPEVRDAVVSRWGAEVAPGGAVDRRAVASRVFRSDAEREWLEELLWPLVMDAMREWREQRVVASPAPEALVVEVPLLFEAGMDAGMDATIAVVADDALRARRAAERGTTLFDERSARQLLQDEKAARATFVVANDGTRAELEQSLSEVLAKLKRG